MLAEQAIFTSLDRRGKAGYHIVSRSPGLSESEATALARWCPSHDGLIFDETNPVSVNFHGLPSGRLALSRTCRGRPEYSGRGGWQTYTHILVFGIEVLRQSRYRPFHLYRDALALGILQYRHEPPATLPQARLLSFFPARNRDTRLATARALGLPFFDSVSHQLTARQCVVLPYDGDRMALAESLLEQVEPEAMPDLSFSTNLTSSSVRPYLLQMVATGATDRAVGAGFHRQPQRSRSAPDL